MVVKTHILPETNFIRLMDELFSAGNKKSELLNLWIIVKMRKWHYAKI